MKRFAFSTAFLPSYLWYLKSTVLTLLILCLFGSVYAQKRNDKYTIVGKENSEDGNAVIVGKVINERTGIGLPAATLSIWNMNRGAVTDGQGRFLLLLPKGKYQITVKYVGMESTQLKINLVGDGTLNFKLKERVVKLDQVVIDSEKVDSNLKGVATGVTKLNIKEIKDIPTFLGEVDVIKSLQFLPGVTSVGDGASGFNVRGGRSDQNLILQNGGQLFNSSHVLGFFSVFNPDATERFTLYKGHIPAQYGGRISSVLDVQMKEGNNEKLKVSGGLGVVASRLVVETPLFDGKTTVLLGGRTSYSNWILTRVKDLDVKDSRARFYDLNGNIVHRLNEDNKITFGYYRSDDFFRFAQDFGFTWDTQLLNLKWTSSFSPNVLSTLTLVNGKYNSGLFDPSGADAVELTNGLDYYQLKENILLTSIKDHEINAGVEFVHYDGRPESSEPLGENSTISSSTVEKEQGRELALYVNDEVNFSEKFSLSLGLRYSIFQNIGPFDVFQYDNSGVRNLQTLIDTIAYEKGSVIKQFQGFSPRISARYQWHKSTSLKLSYNKMRQYIHSLSNTTSPTPVDLWQLSNTYIPPLIADNYAIGIFKNFKDNQWESSIEFYYKDINNFIEYKNFAQLLLNNHLETELLTGTGRSYGAEFFLKKLSGKLTGWLSYTYSRTEVKVVGNAPEETINDGDWFPSNYDKTHSLSLVSKLKIGKNSSFNANFTYNTGRPISAIISTYQVGPTAVPQFSERNRYRIPDYFRFDISFTVAENIWKHRIGRNLKQRRYQDSFTFSVFNLLARKNAYSVFFVLPDEFYLTPQPHKLSVLGAAFPSITYNFKF